MIPQIENSISNEVIQLINYPNKTYRLSNKQIVGKIDNLQAIEQTIFHILNVERYAYLIYDDNYGVELEKYIGKDFSYLEATIEDTIKEALTQDDRIVDIKVTDIVQSKQIIDNPKAKTVNVKFDVYCKEGVIHTEVNINV